MQKDNNLVESDFLDAARALREAIEPNEFMEFLLDCASDVAELRGSGPYHFTLILMIKKIAVPWSEAKEDSLALVAAGIKEVWKLDGHEEFHFCIGKSMEGFASTFKDMIYRTEIIEQRLKGFQALLKLKEAFYQIECKQEEIAA
jgi:hypothetical protein